MRCCEVIPSLVYDKEKNQIYYRACCFCQSDNDNYFGHIDLKDFLKIEDINSYFKNLKMNSMECYKNNMANTLCYYSKETVSTKLNKNNLNIAIDHSCNLKCKMCRDDFIIDKETKEIQFKILEKLKNLSVDNIGLNFCGEIFLWKEELLEYLRSLKNSKIKSITLITNGTLLDDQIINELKYINENIIKLCMFFSVDGITKETYEKIRRGSNFEKVLENILKVKDTGIPIRIMSQLLTEDNIQELNKIDSFWENLGIKNDIVRLCSGIGNEYSRQQYNLMKENKLYKIYKLVNSSYDRALYKHFYTL